ncbi:hypothetical protein [Rhodococcus sp. MEB041]|uniref:hypothetical protein n=1 Tax=Rhodococcus sp. MEB041 TaxID=3040323 RepID=UPI00254D0D56|nr:hypothetical protein [Rhodococcus sp. MEB041]
MAIMQRGAGARRVRTPIVRSADGTSSVESFVIAAVATILLTRAYLELTDYPQVGGGSLHIAHALWGGALMMTALVVGWLFLGFGARSSAVLLGGVGFGLFLDEVGKFVTKDNDYFYGPSAEIMYVTVVLVLVLGRTVRDVREPTPRECLANAAAIASEGLVGGVPGSRRELARELLDRARTTGADPELVASIDTLLSRCVPAPSRPTSRRAWFSRAVPSFVTSTRWAIALSWLMVVTASATVVAGIAQLATGGLVIERDDLDVTLDRMTISGGILWVTACVTVALGLPSLIARRRTASLWPLHRLRSAALIYALLGALVDFAETGFAALTNLAIGLLTLAAISHRITVETARGSAATRSAAVRL